MKLKGDCAIPLFSVLQWVPSSLHKTQPTALLGIVILDVNSIATGATYIDIEGPNMREYFAKKKAADNKKQ